MMQHTIITIGRQFGSGGHEVGNRRNGLTSRSTIII